MSSSLGELRFPLEERFLARVRISSNRFEDWKTIAQREIDTVLLDARSWYYRPNDLKTAYRPVYEQDAIRGFMKPVDNSIRKDLLSLAHLQLTLEDVAYGLHAVSTNDQRAVFAQMYGENFLDGAVLRVLEGATASDPFHFVGLKWLAFASPAQAILANRDFVYFEYSGTTQDAAGRKVLFLFQRSFPLHGEELAEPDKGCMRSVFNQLLLFRMESGGALMQGIGQFDPAAADVPTWVTTRCITETFDSIKNLVGLPDARAIYTAGLIKQPSTPKSASENKACVGCNKKFGMMRSRHGCRSCGQSMCKHCVTTLSFFNDEAFFSAVPTVVTESFCMGCLKHARDRRQMDNLSATLTKTSLSMATSTTTSASGYKTDGISLSGLSSPYESTHSRPPHHREGLRHSIERQIGLHHSDSESSAGGSSRSNSKYAPVLGDDSGVTHSPSSSIARSSRQDSSTPRPPGSLRPTTCLHRTSL